MVSSSHDWQRVFLEFFRPKPKKFCLSWTPWLQIHSPGAAPSYKWQNLIWSHSLWVWTMVRSWFMRSFAWREKICFVHWLPFWQFQKNYHRCWPWFFWGRSYQIIVFWVIIKVKSCDIVIVIINLSNNVSPFLRSKQTLFLASTKDTKQSTSSNSEIRYHNYEYAGSFM